MDFRNYIEKHTVITDGAMGTYYTKVVQNDGAISEYANLSEPDLIKKIHREYIRAGAKLIRTNTFAANSVVLDLEKEKQKELIKRACEIAKSAVEEEKKKVYIAGSIGPIPQKPEMLEEEIVEEYKRICDTLLECGVDVILFETFNNLFALEEVFDYIREKSEVFIMVTLCLNKNGYTISGMSAKRFLEKISTIEAVDGCGFNCGIGSGHMLKLVSKLKLPKNKYIAAIPNAGYPEQLHNRMIFFDNPNYFAENIREMLPQGVRIVGGCCGTTPSYTKLLAKHIDEDQIVKLVEKVEVGKKAITNTIEGKNTFYSKFQSGKKVIAVELDPPYDANFESLVEYAQVIKSKGADIITLADSPGGRSRVDSILMSIKLAQEVEMNVMPHVCCRDKNMIAMRSGILGAYINGIRNLLVVTGDPVPNVNRMNTSGVFDYNSIQLMNFIKEMNEEHFCEEPIYYGGALNYGRGKIEKVIERMERKVSAGAKYFLTQPVYADEDIDRLRYIRKKVDAKMMVGVMPFTSYRNANFIKNEMAGIFVPEEIVNRYNATMSKEEGQEIGTQIMNEIIQKTKDFSDGYYFILPFNRVGFLDHLVIE